MNTTLHITIDKETKQAAQKLARDMGLDLSTLVKSSLKTFVRTQSFHVEKSHRMTPYLERIIAEAKKESQTYGPFNTADKAISFLNSKRWK